jgi:hypothetical protein
VIQRDCLLPLRLARAAVCTSVIVLSVALLLRLLVAHVSFTTALRLSPLSRTHLDRHNMGPGNTGVARGCDAHNTLKCKLVSLCEGLAVHVDMSLSICRVMKAGDSDTKRDPTSAQPCRACWHSTNSHGVVRVFAQSPCTVMTTCAKYNRPHGPQFVSVYHN